MDNANMNMIFCQSCGMPLSESGEMNGTNVDGTKSDDFCMYCFKNGAFNAALTMEEMIDICAPHMVAANENMTEEDAKDMMRTFFPTLKRWQQQ
jgi:hypothetical protein